MDISSRSAAISLLAGDSQAANIQAAICFHFLPEWRAYRAERVKGESDYPARLATFAVMGERHPELENHDMQAAVGEIIVRAAIDHKEWFWDG